jgi:hypothetical protein
MSHTYSGLHPKQCNEGQRPRSPQSPNSAKGFLITCLIGYLFWIYQPDRLRSWRHPRPSEFETWLQQIADLMKELYELLEEMRYLKPNSIAYPSHHSPGINLTLAASVIGMSAEAITLLSLLPYVQKSYDARFDHNHPQRPILSVTQWRARRYPNDEMLLSTAFADMRVDGDLKRSREAFNSWPGEQLKDSYFGDGREEDSDNEAHFLQSWMVGLSGQNEISSRATGDSFPMRGNLSLDLRTSK